MPDLGEAIRNRTGIVNPGQPQRDPALGSTDWNALADVAQLDGFLGVSLWRASPTTRNFLDDLFDAVGGKELHVGGFLPRNGTAWWKAQTTQAHVFKLPIVSSSNNSMLDEWMVEFDTVRTFSSVASVSEHVVSVSNVKVIVDPGPQVVVGSKQILLSPELFHALHDSYVAEGGAQSRSAGVCDRLPAVVFEMKGGQGFRLTGKSLCSCSMNLVTRDWADHHVTKTWINTFFTSHSLATWRRRIILLVYTDWNALQQKTSDEKSAKSLDV